MTPTERLASCLDGKLLSHDRNKFMTSEEGLSLCDPITLGAPPKMRTYLENRLHRAFLAGAEAAERQLTKGKLP